MQPTVHIVMLAADGNDTTGGNSTSSGSIPQWVLDWDQSYVVRYVCAISTIIGGIAVVVSTFKYIRDRCRDRSTADAVAQLGDRLTGQQDLGLAMSTKFDVPEVDWSQGKSQRDKALDQDLAGILRTKSVIVSTDDPDGAIAELRDATRGALQDALAQTAHDQLKTSFETQTYSFRIYPDYGKTAEVIVRKNAENRAGDKLLEFDYKDAPAVFDPLTAGVFYEARRIHFAESYTESAAALQTAQADAAAATALRQQTEDAIRDLENKIKEDDTLQDMDALLTDVNRMKQLEAELDARKADEEMKKDKADDADRKAESDANKRDEAKTKSEAEKQTWKDTADGHGI